MNNNYRCVRKAHGLSIEQAASGIGVQPETLRNWENSESEPVAYELRKMAEYYECSPDYLLGLAEQR